MSARWVAAMVVLGICAAAQADGAAGPAPSFTKRPTATKAADGVKAAVIEFAVSGATDVAVYVEDGGGKVVRHLAAGVLGKNAPAPLKADSLAQSLVWDGKADYGKAAGAGPFKVRVALGLGAAFDKVVISDNQSIAGINSLAVGPDGTVYAMMGAGGTGPVWSGQIMVAFDRQGKYVRQLMPFPAGLAAEQVAGFDVVELNGQPAPVVHAIEHRSFYAASTPRKAGMAVTPDGVVLTMVGNGNLGALDSRGGAPWGKYVGPSLLPKVARVKMTGRPFVAASSDAKWAYVSGLVDEKLDAKGNPRPQPGMAVYRVKLPDRSPAEALFGDPAATGNDQTHLGGPPRGLAVDGKGHLLIADNANGRIVAVDEADGKFVSSFKVEPASAPAAPDADAKQPGAAAGKKPRKSDDASGPDCVAADLARGTIYVTRLAGGGNIELIKYESLANPRPLARMPLANSGNPDCPWLLALDAKATPPVVWLGSDGGSLLRIEDQGDKFAKPVDLASRTIGNGSFVDLSVDHVRNEVYSRCGMGEGTYWWFRFHEQTGEFKKLKLGPLPGAAGSQVVVGPDGTLYCPAYAYHLLRFDSDGRPRPWPTEANKPPAGAVDKEGKPLVYKQASPNALYAPVSMTFLTHTVGVRGDGHIFMFEPSHPGDRPPKMLVEYDPNGQRVGQPIIWKVSDSAVGPKFDPQGNIYVAEQVRPLDQPYPPEFAKLVGEVKLSSSYLDGLKDSVCSMYGSIVKFSPRGGMFHLDGENPFKGTPQLDPSLATIDAASYAGHRNHPLKVTGALWMHMGVSHVDRIGCNCENTRFDVDDFGRVFYPDLGRFRVAVLDTNGNVIAQFGQYGNADTADRIAFSWLIGVGATDQYVYMGDSLNRRLLRAKLVYAAEESCEVK